MGRPRAIIVAHRLPLTAVFYWIHTTLLSDEECSSQAKSIDAATSTGCMEVSNEVA
jgi:hypothetical protein